MEPLKEILFQIINQITDSIYYPVHFMATIMVLFMAEEFQRKRQLIIKTLLMVGFSEQNLMKLMQADILGLISNGDIRDLTFRSLMICRKSLMAAAIRLLASLPNRLLKRIHSDPLSLPRNWTIILLGHYISTCSITNFIQPTILSSVM